MRRYIDNAIFWDFLFAVFIGVCLTFCKPLLKGFLNLPTIENVNSFGGSLISVSATFIGFLLTIMTVIVTFSKGFEEKTNVKKDQKPTTEFPEKTIFEEAISKETKFYGTQIHRRVVDAFAGATCEIGSILFILLISQLNIFSFSIFGNSVIRFCCFVIISLALIRSISIFKLFLKVHLHHKSLSK